MEFRMHPLIGLVTILTVLLLVACAVYVSQARGRYGVKAPAVSGPEGFERALRVQGNTNEAALMFLPALWVAAAVHVPWISAVLGALWLVARIWYALAYANPPRSRGPAFGLSLLALAALVLQALWGLIWILALS
jgi:glutathione S-transferase